MNKIKLKKKELERDERTRFMFGPQTGGWFIQRLIEPTTRESLYIGQRSDGQWRHVLIVPNYPPFEIHTKNATDPAVDEWIETILSSTVAEVAA